MQCEEFHGSVSARVAEGPVKRIHWIPLRRRVSLCWAARGGEALELSNPLSGELGITSAATCLPARSQNHRHTHSYIQRIGSQIFTVNPICAQRRRQSAHWGFLREPPGWLLSREPQSQISVKTALEQAYSCLLRSKNNESATECCCIFANKLLKRQIEAQFNCHFKK